MEAGCVPKVYIRCSINPEKRGCAPVNQVIRTPVFMIQLLNTGFTA